MAVATSTAILAGTIGSAAIGASSARSAAKAQSAAARRAGDAQLQASRESIAFQKEQAELARELMDPFRRAGVSGLDQMMALGGMSGAEAQREAVQAIEESPEFEALQRQGTQGLLSGASATGGLRGGDTQRALAELRPNLLMGLADRNYNRLTGLTNLGQASAAGQAGNAMALGGNIANTLQNQGLSQAQMYTQMGQARAGQSLATGQALSGLAGGLSQLGMADAMGMFNDKSGVSKLGLFS